jgi:hypothetical protein
MALTYHQHLFVIEYRFEAQSGSIERIGCHQEVDLVTEQGADASELEFLLTSTSTSGQLARYGETIFSSH